MSRRFERFQALVDLNILKDKHITIVGVGGVGGFATEAIARCGVGKITIIDMDIVDITNINRQIIALSSTIGQKKVDVMKKRILDINPECNVITYDTFLDQSNISELIKNTDYVIDCIDSLDSKVSLIEYLVKNKIKFISSMGTAKKFHPEMLEVSKLAKTSYDPIAKILRKRLKDLRIDTNKVKVVYSKELSANTKMLGSTSFVPSSAGLLLASVVINELTNH